MSCVSFFLPRFLWALFSEFLLVIVNKKKNKGLAENKKARAEQKQWTNWKLAIPNVSANNNDRKYIVKSQMSKKKGGKGNSNNNSR